MRDSQNRNEHGGVDMVVVITTKARVMKAFNLGSGFMASRFGPSGVGESMLREEE